MALIKRTTITERITIDFAPKSPTSPTRRH